jgi:hypothetical protein
MNKSAMILGALLVCVAAGAQAAQFDYGSEVRGVVNGWMPEAANGGLYDSSLGLEVQYRNWASDPVGWAVSLGWSDWSVPEDAGIATGALDSYDGSISTLPLGVSGLYKLADFADWNVTLEAGLRYVLVNADITARELSTGDEVDVDVGDGFLFLVGADYERNLGSDWSLVAGGGYQIDITKSDFEVHGEALRSSELEAFFLRLGAKMSF